MADSELFLRMSASSEVFAAASYEERTRLKHLIELGSTNCAKSQLYQEQHGRCAVCKHGYPQELLCIDHDHETELVRGLLCRRCNILEALCADERLSAEFEKYRRAPPARERWKYEGFTKSGFAVKVTEVA